MTGTIVILAQDFGDLIGVLIVIAVIVFSGIQQFIQKIRETMEKQREEQERRRRGESYSSGATVLDRDIEDIESEWDVDSILRTDETPEEPSPSYQYDPLQSSTGTMPPPVPQSPRQPATAPPPIPPIAETPSPPPELARMQHLMQQYEKRLRHKGSPKRELAEARKQYRQLLGESCARRYIAGKGTGQEMELDLSPQGARKAYIYREIFGPPRGRMPFLRNRRSMR
jgi:hypothetical protein